jgi:hypothetical protein
MSDSQDVIDLVLGKLDRVQRLTNYWKALCPAHDDSEPSLNIMPGKDQPVVLICRANCATEDVLAAIGLTLADICQPKEQERPKGEWTPHGEATAVYTYTDEDGTVLYEVMRTAAKQFPVRVPDSSAKTGWRWRLGDTRRVLYRLPKLRYAIDAGRTIYVPEGEKDVHSVERAGGIATCNPGGAGKWNPDFSEALRDATVVIVADADKPGRAHARMVAAALDGIAASVEIRESAEGKDVTDHLASGRTLDELVVTTESSPDAPAELALDLLVFVEQPDPPLRWVIPGLLEHGDRLIWTGLEGLGKTTVSRQVSVAASAGVQPFNPAQHYEPQRVLFMDCENRVRRSRRQFQRLTGVCNAKFRQIEPGMFRIVHRPEGINLVNPEEAAFVLERITAYRPDLIIIGPLYKLHNTDANDESAARAIVRVLEQAVSVCDSALIVEAHSAHGFPRSLRPRGSSLFMAWPDYGFGIEMADTKNPDPDDARRRVAVKAWRGPRDENDWPRELVWGSETQFPWVVPGLRLLQAVPSPALSVPTPQPRYVHAPLPDFNPHDEDDGDGLWPAESNGSAVNGRRRGEGD